LFETAEVRAQLELWSNAQNELVMKQKKAQTKTRIKIKIEKKSDCDSDSDDDKPLKKNKKKIKTKRAPQFEHMKSEEYSHSDEASIEYKMDLGKRLGRCAERCTMKELDSGHAVWVWDEQESRAEMGVPKSRVKKGLSRWQTEWFVKFDGVPRCLAYKFGDMFKDGGECKVAYRHVIPQSFP
jgi:hypothetical protein